jgi:hypothetical protein
VAAPKAKAVSYAARACQLAVFCAIFIAVLPVFSKIYMEFGGKFVDN